MHHESCCVNPNQKKLENMKTKPNNTHTLNEEPLCPEATATFWWKAFVECGKTCLIVHHILSTDACKLWIGTNMNMDWSPNLIRSMTSLVLAVMDADGAICSNLQWHGVKILRGGRKEDVENQNPKCDRVWPD